MAKTIITILFLCLYVCIADRVIESDVGKMKNAHQLMVHGDDCRSLKHYEYICSLAWDGTEEVENISFHRCCEAANRVSKNCMSAHHEYWHIYYLQKTCNHASVSCLGAPATPQQPSPIPQPPSVSPPPTPQRPSPIPRPPSVSPSPTPEQPSPIPQPPSASPPPTPQQPSPIPHPHSVSPTPTPEQPSPIPQPPSVSPSPTPQQPSPIPQPPSVSPPPTPQQPSPIPHPHSVSPSPTPKQPSPIPQPPSVSPSPTPQPSPDQPPSSPPPTPNHVIPIPRPNPLVPPPPPNHPIRPKNCLVAVVRYDSCDPKAPDTSHSSATPYEKQFIPSESGIAKIYAADCCVALSIIDNKCDNLVTDMSYVKLREFYRLEQACSLPYVEEART